MIVELPSPHHATAGWVGVPGERTFYLQFQDDEQLVTIVCEKSQVAGIAELIAELLVRVGDEPASDWDREAMALRDPIEPAWRLGPVAVGVDPEDARFLLELVELVPDDEEGDELRAWLNRDQARRLAAHGAEVVGEGRPTCQLCGRPEGPDGHVCPASNGHGRLSR